MKTYQTSVLTRSGHETTTAISILGAAGLPVAVYIRTDYTLHQSQQVVDWLNGEDQPLPDMVDAQHDDFYKRHGDRPLYLFRDLEEDGYTAPDRPRSPSQ